MALKKNEIDGMPDLLRRLVDDYLAGEKEKEQLRVALAAADTALIEARDTLGGDEDDDVYWAWFNRHDEAVFARIVETSPERTNHD